MEFFQRTDAPELTLIDKETGTPWGFVGDARPGELAGEQLTRFLLITEYWFDWSEHYPYTRIFDPRSGNGQICYRAYHERVR